MHFAADQETIETTFRIIVSANHLSLDGAVAEMSEVYESFHERTGATRCDGTIKFPTRAQCDQERSSFGFWWPSVSNFVFQQYGERNEKLSQQDKLRKCCMDAEFLSVVENRQYFMTKDIGDLTQFHSVACRENTLPRKDEASQP